VNLLLPAAKNIIITTGSRGIILKKFFLVIFLTASIFLAFGSGKQAETGPFAWSMGLQNTKTNTLVPFSAPVQSYDGEQFRILIKPDKDSFFYVIAQSPDGNDVVVLYNGPIKSGETWYSQVIELTPPGGSESLYIIASRGEQTSLSRLIASANANGKAGSMADGKADASLVQKRAIINEVLSLRSEVSQFKEQAETPVLIGGVARSTQDAAEATQYSGLEVYVKTISIEH